MRESNILSVGCCRVAWFTGYLNHSMAFEPEVRLAFIDGPAKCFTNVSIPRMFIQRMYSEVFAEIIVLFRFAQLLILFYRNFHQRLDVYVEMIKLD